MHPAIYYSVVDSEIQNFQEVLSTMKQDLFSFEQKYQGKEIPDNILFAINIRKRNINKLVQSYNFFTEYIRSVESENEKLKSEIFQNRTQREDNIIENFYEREARRKAMKNPPIAIGGVFKQIYLHLKETNGS